MTSPVVEASAQTAGLQTESKVWRQTDAASLPGCAFALKLDRRELALASTHNSHAWIQSCNHRRVYVTSLVGLLAPVQTYFLDWLN